MRKAVYSTGALVLTVLCISCRKPIFIQNHYYTALAIAKWEGKNHLVVFDWWGNPVRSTEVLFADRRIKNKLNNTIVTVLKVDDRGFYPGNTAQTIGQINANLEQEKYHGRTQPQYWLLNPEGKILYGPVGYCKPDQFIAAFDSVLAARTD